MLRVDLAELLRRSGKYIEVDLDDMPKSDDDVKYLEPAVGQVTISNTGDIVLVRGRFKTIAQLECGRCLGEVRERIDAEVEEQFTLADVDSPAYHDASAQVAIVSDEENEVPEGLMDGSVMDMNVLIRQATILALPLSPLCKEGCKGFCGTCGKNRNDPNSGCACEEKPRNTPLAALKQLYEENAAGLNGRGIGGNSSSNGSGGSH